MKIAISQLNPKVGDLEGNYFKIISEIERGKKEGINLVIFPELVLTGYPPKDLLMKNSFICKNIEYLEKIVSRSRNISVILGFVDKIEGSLYNAAAFVNNGVLQGVQHKLNLPNYDVFDEKRYFSLGKESKIFELMGMKIGINICEDIWTEEPTRNLKEKGAELIINLSASPFHAKKYKLREELISKRAKENSIPIIYANLVGGQDDLIFDGRSYFFNGKGELLSKGKGFQEDFMVLPNLDSKPIQSLENEVEEIHDALVLGIKDYVRKNKFDKVVIGFSGGIDSALTAALAVEALGKDNVLGVTMPSHFSSTGSVNHSLELAKNLGVECLTIPIKETYTSYLKSLEQHFEGTEFNVAEENIQARIRGNLLMALSNKHGYLVLATGNKSEFSMGYSTLYGDMSGGFSVLIDLFKTMVYKVSNNVNKRAGREVIPISIIEKEPSAELKEGQKDSDSLPPYEILDSILKAYVENDLGRDEIISKGFDVEIVNRVIKAVDRSEYKRQQAAIGPKITFKAYGSGRRMPITNGWKEK